MPRLGRARPVPRILFRPVIASIPTATITEHNLPSNHNGNITVHVVGTNTSFSSSTTWTLSGVAGWSKASQTFVDATHYTIVLTPPSAATPPNGATGTLTLTEGVTGTTAPTTSVGTPSFTFTPTSGNISTTPTLTFTGVNTIWSTETPSGLLSESGGTGASIGTPTISTNTSMTAVLTTGTQAGSTLTITDNSTGATNTFNVIRTSAGTYYFRADGNDNNTGLIDSSGGAFLSPTRFLNGPPGGWLAGDQIKFDSAGGNFAVGSWVFTTSGTDPAAGGARITISGINNPTLNSGTGIGMFIKNCEFVTVTGFTVTTSTASASSFTGSAIGSTGRDMTAYSWGILVYNTAQGGNPLRQVYVDSCTVTNTVFGIGYQTPNYNANGLIYNGYVDSRITNCTLDGVIIAGIWILGGNGFNGWSQQQLACPNIKTTFLGMLVSDCNVKNMPGTGASAEPYFFQNITSLTCVRCQCSNISYADTFPNTLTWGSASFQMSTVDRCTWRWCESLTNKSSSADCEGFDVDLACTNCVVENCFSHENNGPGFATFSGTGGHILRNCASRNDCQTVGAAAIWNFETVYNCDVYMDSSCTANAAAVLMDSGLTATFYNCIFELNSGRYVQKNNGTTTFIGCDYFWTGVSPTTSFQGPPTNSSIITLSGWRGIGNESKNGITYGQIADPLLSSPTTGSGIGYSPGTLLIKLPYFDIPSNSPAVGSGIPLEILGIVGSLVDFHGYPSRVSGGVDAGIMTYNAVNFADIPAGGSGGGAPIVGSAIVGGAVR